MVSASLYFHFTMFDLHRPIPVLSRFTHFQCNHGASDPGPRSSDGMYLSLCGSYRRWWVHAGGLLTSGLTECTKQFLDFMSLFTTRDCIGNAWDLLSAFVISHTGHAYSAV